MASGLFRVDQYASEASGFASGNATAQEGGKAHLPETCASSVLSPRIEVVRVARFRKPFESSASARCPGGDDGAYRTKHEKEMNL